MGHALTGGIQSIRFRIEGVLGQSRERQDLGGGGTDDDVEFSFHVSMLFRVVFLFCYFCHGARLLSLSLHHRWVSSGMLWGVTLPKFVWDYG